jgi:hypothetical protein
MSQPLPAPSPNRDSQRGSMMASASAWASVFTILSAEKSLFAVGYAL